MMMEDDQRGFDRLNTQLLSLFFLSHSQPLCVLD